MKRIIILVFFASLCTTATAQVRSDWQIDSVAYKYAEQIDTNLIWKHVRALSHDSMMGRRPGTPGEQLTLKYLSAAFKEAGLKPGYKDNYLQPVELLNISTAARLSLRRKNGVAYEVPDSLVLVRSYTSKHKNLKGLPVHFAGYGIVAPEYGWDDYKNADLKGKVVMVLFGEPKSFAKKRDSALQFSHHTGIFVKEEYARKHGAAAVIVLTPYDYFYASEKWTMQHHFAALAKGEENKEMVFAWLCISALSHVLDTTKLSLRSLAAMAEDSLFQPLPLPADADIRIKNITSPFTSYNVVGYIEGSDPALKKECIVYTTHWDAFGTGLPERGDSIYNGAMDNAGGIAEMIGIARSMASLPKAPARSVVFVATTSEEQGILGAEAYARTPLFPVRSTVAVIGMDIFAPWGKTTGIGNQAFGYTDIDGLFQMLADKRNLPYHGPRYFSVLASSDQYRLMQRGVPAVFAGMDTQSFLHSKEEKDSVSRRNVPHTPFDEISELWDLRSAVEEARLMYELGFILANTNRKPRWTVPR